jgi:hypothetical protein
MNFEHDADAMEFTTSKTKSFQKNNDINNNKNLAFDSNNNEYKNHNNSFDSLSLNPPRSNCTMISQSSNDRDGSDESDDSVDCDIPDDFDNLNFIINPQQKSEKSYLPLVNSFNNDFKNLDTTIKNDSCLLEKNANFNGDYLNSSNKIQYLLMANTSPAVKINEESLTYLNQGQSYELKFNMISSNNNSVKKFGSDNEDLYNTQKDNKFNNIDSKDEKLYLSVIRLCFWERKLQEIEQEEIKEVCDF